MVRHVGIGDGEDHPRPARPQPIVQQGGQMDHPGRSRFIVLGVHAMVGGETHHGPRIGQGAPGRVQGPVEAVALRLSGGVLVLNVIRGGKVHQPEGRTGITGII